MVNEDNGSRVIEVFSGTLWEAEMIKSMLEDVGIKSFLKKGSPPVMLNKNASDSPIE